MGAHSVSRSFTRQENGIPSGGKSNFRGLYPLATADSEQGHKTRRHEHGTRSTSPKLKQSKHPVACTDSIRTSTSPMLTQLAVKHLPNLPTTKVSINKGCDGISETLT